jgi:hypothetical protein
MRKGLAVLSALFLVACGTPDEEPAPGPQAVAEATSIARFAGTWSGTVTLEGVDEPVTTTMTGGAAGDDWTMSVPDRESIPLRVHVSGDSLITQSEEYESILRPGVTARVRTASVLRNGEMAGSVLVTYITPDGQEQVRGTVRSTRVP